MLTLRQVHKKLSQFKTDGCKPTITIIEVIDPDTGQAREVMEWSPQGWVTCHPETNKSNLQQS